MHPYRKLQQLCIGLIMSPCAFAITLDPIHIETTQGNLLYAEIPFRNANPNEPLQVELASIEDLRNIGASHQPPRALNFFTRKNAKGEGAIVITSSQPIYEQELNIVIKIKTGPQTRLQHIQRKLRAVETPQKPVHSLNEQPLIPTYVVSEQEIALNLPVSAQMRQPPAMQPTKPTTPVNAPSLVEEKILRTKAITPPPMQVIQAAPLAPKQPTQSSARVHQPSVQTAAVPNTAVTTTPPPVPTPETTSTPASSVVSPPQPVEPISAAVTPEPSPEQSIAAVNEVPPTTVNEQQPVDEIKAQEATSFPEEKRTEQATDSAPDATSTAQEVSVKATPEIAQPTAQPTTSEKHVVQANESLWRIASQIARQSNQSIQDVMQHIQQQNQHAFINGDMNRLKKGVVLNLVGSHSPTQSASKQSKPTATTASTQIKTKYKLQDAQMRLVGEHDNGQATGTAKKTTSSSSTSTELATKVMTSREKTVKLQKVVQALDIQLQQKDHKIKLLNAKLAQLEAQLKRQQQNAIKP